MHQVGRMGRALDRLQRYKMIVVRNIAGISVQVAPHNCSEVIVMYSM